MALAGGLTLFWISVLFFLLVACAADPTPARVASGATQTGLFEQGLGIEPTKPAQPLKIFIQEPGIVELMLAELAEYGFSGDPETLRLTHRGRTQPLWLVEDGTEWVLRFYGRAGESLYTQASIYLLASGDNVPRWSEEAPPGSSDGAALSKQTQAILRLEENLRYSPKVATGDHFFWNSLVAPGTQAVSFSLPSLAEGPGQIRVGVWASTEASQDPDHRLRAVLNDQPLFDETWDGIGRRSIIAEIPAGALLPGENELLIESPGGLDVVADIIFLDWVEIQYPRKLEPEASQLAFLGSGQVFELSGFKEAATIYDVTDPEAVLWLKPEEKTSGRLTVSTMDGHEYLAVGPGGYQKPVQIAPLAVFPALDAAGAGGDYVAVGPEDLLAPLQPLLEWREGQGLTVRAVSLEAIYDQFNYGYPEPDAIQAFMQFAGEHWDPAPRYLLLVGDTTYDPRGYMTPPEANRLPAFMVQTIFGGETATDIPFGQLNEDPWPEIAIGRIPARTADQVETVVGKILAYESGSEAGDWQQRVIAVADGRETRFRDDALRFLDRFSTSFQSTLVAPEAGTEGTNEQIRGHLSQGSLLVAYFGHGSVTQWGRDDLFTVDDVTGLANGNRLPIVVNMTCLTGLFTHPEVDSLAETLLWEKKGGAVAVLAPTSLTLPSDQSFLSDALAEAVQGSGAVTLGDISLEARRQIQADTQGGQDVLMTFLLFGDPALQVASGGG
jgi:hypothetical protein